jgi:hypothetical protein
MSIVLYVRIVIAIGISLLLPLPSFIQELSYADSLKNSILQRIGNYNMEMKTDPINPIVGQNTKILLRISSVNGEELVDLPIIIRIFKDGIELEKTHPILIPYGHNTYSYIFLEPGLYALDVVVDDYAYSGQDITFTFPISVSSFSAANFGTYIIIITAAIMIVLIVALIFLKRRRNSRQRKRSVEDVSR